MDSLLGISETPKIRRKQVGKAREYARKYRVTANARRCAIVVRNKDKVRPVTFKWKWGQDELLIVNQYTHLGVNISKYCSWGSHIAEVTGKGNRT